MKYSRSTVNKRNSIKSTKYSASAEDIFVINVDDFIKQSCSEEINKFVYNSKCKSMKSGDFSPEEIKKFEKMYGFKTKKKNK